MTSPTPLTVHDAAATARLLPFNRLMDAPAAAAAEVEAGTLLSPPRMARRTAPR